MSETPKHWDFNPQSPNAMFQKILSRLDEQDRTSRSEREAIKVLISDVKMDATELRELHEKRLAKLERFVITHKAKVAVLVTVGSGAVSLLAWLAQRYLPFH